MVLSATRVGEFAEVMQTEPTVAARLLKICSSNSANGCQMGVKEPKQPSQIRMAIRNLNLLLR